MDPQATPPMPQPDYDTHRNQRVTNELAVMQPGETVIAAIKRHPIGLIGMYIGVSIVIIALAVLCFVIAPGVSASVGQFAAAVFFLIAILAALYSLIITKVYWGNTWLLTSDSVTQISQTGLFHRQSSQLSLEHIEDVVAEQNGILTHIFDFGLLKVQTAAEHSKFLFYYCPNPNFYAQKILAAREAFHAQSSAQHAVMPASHIPSQQPQATAGPKPEAQQPPRITF